MKPGDQQYNPKAKETALAVLDQEGGSYQRAARLTGISAPTLKRWNDARDPDVLELARNTERENFIKEAWTTINECITELKKKVPDASAKELAIIIGILFDKIAKTEMASTGLTIEEVKRLEIKGLSDVDLEAQIKRKVVEVHSQPFQPT